ncbi:MAG: MBL fold metallo-hydrolase [archaeon]
MKVGDLDIKWLGHAGFLITNTKRIYIDPYNISSQEKADIILITHSHFDHCSLADIEKIIKKGTVVVISPDVQSKINKFQGVEIQIMEPGDEISIGSVKIVAVAAYNKNKDFHKKSENWNGYLVKQGQVVIYHAGDTDLVPEMEKLTGYKSKSGEFVALLPVGGTYTMNYEEAAEAAKIIKPSLAIPMHFGGGVVGTEEDASKFIELCQEEGINAMILEKS